MADPRRAREEPSSEIALEDFEDALVDGDRSVRVGTARAALAYPTFRRVYFGSLASSIGSWMQNVILGAYVYQETLSSTWVALVTLAQLGPLLLLSLVGGMIADRFERRTVLILVSVEQTAFSLLIAKLTAAEHPSMWLLLAAVLAIGIGQAIYAVVFGADPHPRRAARPNGGDLAQLCEHEPLPRHRSCHRGILFARVGAPWVFVGNAVTYGFIIIALWGVRLPRGVLEHAENRLRRLLGGVRVARDDRVVGRCLTTMVAFSLFCLPIAVLMPVLAHENLGIDGESVAHGFLYATFGSGAVVGALSIGTFLANRDLKRIVRVGLVGFAVSLAAFALDRNPAVAYPIGFVVGAFYFAVVTSLSTVLQQRLDDKVRGRVMALWIMAFGGTVPIGAMAAAPLSDAIGITAVALGGAVVAALLALWANLSEPAGAGAP